METAHDLSTDTHQLIRNLSAALKTKQDSFKTEDCIAKIKNNEFLVEIIKS
jgi:hypothetical protein